MTTFDSCPIQMLNILQRFLVKGFIMEGKLNQSKKFVPKVTTWSKKHDCSAHNVSELYDVTTSPAIDTRQNLAAISPVLVLD